MLNKLVFVAGILLLFSFVSKAQIAPAKIFSDNMVLQREAAIPVWGSTNLVEQITVHLIFSEAKTVAQADGQ
ncbi:MAG: hypothetical protein A2W90_05530 [Bacteroidetes bacterium GWF2_42_66]|nr:MAG: hypothetical protein A2W92_00910 [Bacteroidetes bacterium GWA2_42_15]OFX96125.1 MAG: hypothetical protein A2W89_21295 [Bacteroidetes bacterium GWE2_42_39]OFY45173.1 MAG: hypothetical protein A2W90_05530 [Bacteroidetes bacterium GWF2_42_66]HBL73596.1 hypothetical protein [Prolixibacteraceae bacterium]HCR89380.1 hypothetical protein [Prolixibacteraceae bacterium]